jgi:hypothetical protein
MSTPTDDIDVVSHRSKKAREKKWREILYIYVHGVEKMAEWQTIMEKGRN